VWATKRSVVDSCPTVSAAWAARAAAASSAIAAVSAAISVVSGPLGPRSAASSAAASAGADRVVGGQRRQRAVGRSGASQRGLDHQALEGLLVLLALESLLDRALVGRVEELALLGRQLGQDLLVVLVGHAELGPQAVEDDQLALRHQAVGDQLAHGLLVGAQPGLALLGALVVQEVDVAQVVGRRGVAPLPLAQDLLREPLLDVVGLAAPPAPEEDRRGREHHRHAPAVDHPARQSAQGRLAGEEVEGVDRDEAGQDQGLVAGDPRHLGLGLVRGVGDQSAPPQAREERLEAGEGANEPSPKTTSVSGAAITRGIASKK
jgi:hypothetical protein